MPEPAPSSVNPAEVAHFARFAAEWWHPDGEFKPLHKLNPVRLGVIRDAALAHFGLPTGGLKPLKGLRVLDAGCGGGLVAEPLARMGAEVLGIDAAEPTILAAQAHADACGVALTYRATTVEALEAEGVAPFDLVVSLEVVEHVTDPDAFLASCARLVRSGGLMVVSTLNRSARGVLLGKYAAEYLLRWVSPGTHDARKFRTPEEIARALRAGGLEPDPAIGLTYLPLEDRFTVSADTGVNYMVVARRAG